MSTQDRTPPLPTTAPAECHSRAHKRIGANTPKPNAPSAAHSRAAASLEPHSEAQESRAASDADPIESMPRTNSPGTASQRGMTSEPTKNPIAFSDPHETPTPHAAVPEKPTPPEPAASAHPITPIPHPQNTTVNTPHANPSGQSHTAVTPHTHRHVRCALPQTTDTPMRSTGTHASVLPERSAPQVHPLRLKYSLSQPLRIRHRLRGNFTLCATRPILFS